MVAKRYVVPFLLVLALSGCYDRFQGPSFRNEFGTSIAVAIKYADGTVSRHDWPPCHEAFVGKSDKPGDAIQDVEVIKEGELLYRFDAERVRQLLEKEEAHKGYSAWSIGPDGVRFVTSPDSQGCKQGKRVD